MIKIQNFSHNYGSFQAVSDLNLDIEKGDIFGFIGPNGAGKTTTIRFLTTLLRPTKGSAWVNCYSVSEQKEDVQRSIGFMPDDFGVYDGMCVWEFLDFFAQAYGIPRKKRMKIVPDIMELLDLTGKKNELVNGLSRGMKQRMCLAKTLVHDPPVLILDEPASGLDPRARIEIKELLKELQNMGKTILISSHILSELADCCNKVGIIERGKLVAQGSIDKLMRMVQKYLRVEITVQNNHERAQNILNSNSKIDELSSEKNTFTFSYTGDSNEIAGLNSQLVKNDIDIQWIKPVEVSLEEIFIRLTKGKVN